MVQLKLVLDTRRAKADSTFSILFRITNIKKVYTIQSGISIPLEFWNESKREIKKDYPNASIINLKLSKKYYEIQAAILKLEHQFTIDDLKELINPKPKVIADVTFKSFADKLIKDMLAIKKTGNAMVYQTSINRLLKFCSNDKIRFNQIDYSLLNSFVQQLQLDYVKVNTINNYLRAIRSKLVDRIHYPFYDIQIKGERTQKRSISKEQMLDIEQLNIKKNSTEWHSRNYFMLSFYLIGISFTDLAYLKPANIKKGRVLYNRRKTHKLFSIKLHPKAFKVLEYYKSDRKYLLPVLKDSVNEDDMFCKKTIIQWIKTTNKYLQKIGDKLNFEEHLTTYVTRHTFATLAKKLGYSNELIAEALGREYGNKVTNIYLDSFDKQEVDEMHEKVISLA